MSTFCCAVAAGCPCWQETSQVHFSTHASCLQVMTVVRSLLGRGITICATIHCPPPHTFNLFDRVLIMQRGRVAYFGLNGQPAINYFYDHFEKVSYAAPS